jgi:hypothetical protein
MGHSTNTIYGAFLSQIPLEKTPTAHSHVHYLKLLSISVPQTSAGMIPFGSVGVGLLWSPNSSTTARLKRFVFWRVRLWRVRFWHVRLWWARLWQARICRTLLRGTYLRSTSNRHILLLVPGQDRLDDRCRNQRGNGCQWASPVPSAPPRSSLNPHSALLLGLFHLALALLLAPSFFLALSRHLLAVLTAQTLLAQTRLGSLLGFGSGFSGLDIGLVGAGEGFAVGAHFALDARPAGEVAWAHLGVVENVGAYGVGAATGSAHVQVGAVGAVLAGVVLFPVSAHDGCRVGL